EARWVGLYFRALAHMAQIQESGVGSREAGGRGGMGQEQMAVATAGTNRIMIYGPKSDGTYIIEFKTAAGETLAISIPGSEARVLRHFQERMPYGLFVPDLQEPK